jgi:inorganic triphosphatase YgiF
LSVSDPNLKGVFASIATMSVEIELKLAIAPDAVARLRRHPLLKAATAVRHKLYGVYFDTPEFELFRRKCAFRLRREGYHWVQTVKLDKGSAAGLSARPEYEVQVTGNQPDPGVLPAAARAALGEGVVGRLVPVFSTDFRRTTWLLERPLGTVEVALDVGVIKAGTAELPLAEVELELKAGDAGVLFEVARELLESVALVPEYRSKALRGYGLVGIWQEAPCKAVPVEVGRGMPAAEAWRRSLLAALEQLGRNLPGLLAEDDPEYLHQTRVAVRRLRTMLGLGRSLGLEQDGWVGELRWFMAELAPARDWDVLAGETLAAVCAGLPAPERLDRLLERAGQARAKARERARAAVRDRRLAVLLLDMGAALLAEREGGATLARWANEVLQQRLRRFRKGARHFAGLDAAGRHWVRIAAKRLRYAGEAFMGLYGRRAGRYLDRVARLQDDLGAANDRVVAGRLLAQLNHDRRVTLAVGLAEGFLAGMAGQPVAELAALVDGVRRARPFWR